MDSHKDFIQASYEVLNSFTLMEKTSKKNTTGSGSETKNDEE